MNKKVYLVYWAEDTVEFVCETVKGAEAKIQELMVSANLWHRVIEIRKIEIFQAYIHKYPQTGDGLAYNLWWQTFSTHQEAELAKRSSVPTADETDKAKVMLRGEFRIVEKSVYP